VCVRDAQKKTLLSIALVFFSRAPRPLPSKNTELTKKPVEGFSAGLVNDSLFEWQVTIMGPPDTY
jgi:ubiquitin-protein ligase